MFNSQWEVCRTFELDWSACPQGPDESMRNDVDFLILTAKGDIETLRKLVPAPLEATDEVTIAMFQIKEAERDGAPSWFYPFQEWNIGIKARLTEEPFTEGLFLVQDYVDDDAALVYGREVWGYPKKMGELHVTPATSEESTHYNYTVARRGTQLVSATIEGLESIPLEEFPLNGTGYAICFRQVPSPNSVELEKQQLVFVQSHFEPQHAKRGTGTVTLTDGPFDQLPVGPLSDITAYFGRCKQSHRGINNLVIDAHELARPIDLSRAGVTAQS